MLNFIIDSLYVVFVRHASFVSYGQIYESSLAVLWCRISISFFVRLNAFILIPSAFVGRLGEKQRNCHKNF